MKNSVPNAEQLMIREQESGQAVPESHHVVHRSIPEMIGVQGLGRGEAVALEEVGRPAMTYGRLSFLVSALVGDLRAAGVKREDRVALVIPNGRDMSTTLLGVCSAAIAAPLNPAYQESEYADYFREIRVSFLVIRRGVDSPARVAAAKMGIRMIELTEDAGALLPEGVPTRGGAPATGMDQPDPDDIALILLTSGSTGRSKKVPLTHRNICVSVRDICRTLELTSADRCLCMWEQFHIGGLVDLLMVPLASGGSVICTGGFDAARFFEMLGSKRPTWYQGVPATVHELMAHARKHGIAPAPNSLRFVRVTASALAPKLMGELEEYFGVPVITTFGMTEAAPLITTNLLPPHARKPGSTGPSCGPDVAVMDADGNLLKTGEAGEVVVRGENVMSGYEDAPEANAHSFRHGWFHTGDIGYLDEDGYLFLKGRIKESINRGGEKITPQEIDDVLLTHPEIAEAISFHIPHSVLGEDVAAAVVLHKPGSLTENDIRDYVAASLAEFKVPRKVLFVEGFTRGPSGKVNRSALAEVLGVTAEKPYEPPATPLEQTLADIWARELHVPKVGRNDAFADLGGDSLSGTRMILEVEKALGRQLPIRALFKVSTVREMAEVIASAPTEEDVLKEVFSAKGTLALNNEQYRKMLSVMSSGTIPSVKIGSLVKIINPNGSLQPLFWCFNAPDQEMPALASALGSERPLYGLYSGGGQLGHGDLPAIASHYVREIMEIQPEGPLLIGGNCRGARVGFRVATKLQELGRTVSHLAMGEYFDKVLYGYRGKMLLMHGKHSEVQAQKWFRWGSPGWKWPFFNVPRVEWMSGAHGRFFDPENIGSLAGHVNSFLADQPKDLSLKARLKDFGIILIHHVPTLFYCYTRKNRRV
jgi:acyl-CoA synthetase (AMP-forming)/AMP-acid ligase II/acyl carrier protein